MTFGAVVFEGVNDVLLTGLPPGSAGPFVVGMLTASVTALAAIWILLDYVRRHTYTVFVVYRLVVAAIILLIIAFGRPAEHVLGPARGTPQTCAAECGKCGEHFSALCTIFVRPPSCLARRG